MIVQYLNIKIEVGGVQPTKLERFKCVYICICTCICRCVCISEGEKGDLSYGPEGPSIGIASLGDNLALGIKKLQIFMPKTQ